MKKLILILIFCSTFQVSMGMRPMIEAQKQSTITATQQPTLLAPTSSRPNLINPTQTPQQQFITAATAPTLLQPTAFPTIQAAVPPKPIPRGQGPLIPQTVQSLINGGCNPALSKFMDGPSFDSLANYQSNIDSLTKFANDLSAAVAPSGIQVWADDLKNLQDILNSFQDKQKAYNDKNSALKACTQNCDSLLNDVTDAMNAILDCEANLMTLFSKYGYSYPPIRARSPIQLGGVTLKYLGKELSINNIVNIDDSVISGTNIQNFANLLAGALTACGDKINIIKNSINDVVNKIKTQAITEEVTKAALNIGLSLPIYIAMGPAGIVLGIPSLLEWVGSYGGLNIQFPGIDQINSIVNDIFETIANDAVNGSLSIISGIQDGLVNFVQNPAKGLLSVGLPIYAIQAFNFAFPEANLVQFTLAVVETSALYSEIMKIPGLSSAVSWAEDQANTVINALNPTHW